MWHASCLVEKYLSFFLTKEPEELLGYSKLNRLKGGQSDMDLPTEFFPRRTWSFIHALLRDVVYLFIILAILTLATWKLVEFIP